MTCHMHKIHQLFPSFLWGSQLLTSIYSIFHTILATLWHTNFTTWTYVFFLPLSSKERDNLRYFIAMISSAILQLVLLISEILIAINLDRTEKLSWSAIFTPLYLLTCLSISACVLSCCLKRCNVEVRDALPLPSPTHLRSSLPNFSPLSSLISPHSPLYTPLPNFSPLP